MQRKIRAVHTTRKNRKMPLLAQIATSLASLTVFAPLAVTTETG